MKKVYRLLICLLGLLFTSVITHAQMNLREEFKKGKETETGVFVITKDSVKHTGTKLDWNNAFATFKIDDTKYKRRRLPDIIAYQDEDSYTAYIPDIEDDAIRLRKGKINLYTYEVVTKWGYSNRKGTNDANYSRRYMLEKQKNDFYGLSYFTLEKFFSDKPLVLQKYHEIFPNRPEGGKPDYNDMPQKEQAILLQQLISLVEMYNEN